MNFSFVHEFEIDPKGYWQLFFSPEFNEALFRELKMQNYRVLSLEDDGKRLRRVQSMEPTTPLPSFLQSVVKSTGYTETDDLDWATNVMRVKIETQMFKDRFHMEGDYLLTPLDGGRRCRREFKGEVKVAMALIGGRIEKFMMEQLRDSYDVAARVTRRSIEEKRAEPPRPAS